MNVKESAIDHVDFNNGKPLHIQGWVDIDTKRLSYKQQAYLVLAGEAITIYLTENSPCIDSFNARDVKLSYCDCRFSKTFAIWLSDRAYFCKCATHEEMMTWAESIEYARKRDFNSHYKLLMKIGEGRFSNVYVARAKKDKTKFVAVKVIDRDCGSHELDDMLRKERYINSVLRHTNIVRGRDMFSTVEKDHMVFDLMRGGNLRSVMKKRKILSEYHTRSIMTQLMRALAYLHSKNVIHRDIRPGNIFCSETQIPTLCALGDFGSAIFSTDAKINQDVHSGKIGVVPYVSIDICRGVQYGPSADMWSAGVVFYEMLVGETPFHGASAEESLQLIIEGKYQLSSSKWNGISKEAKSLVSQLLQNDPSKRLNPVAALQHTWFQISNNSLGAGKNALSHVDVRSSDRENSKSMISTGPQNNSATNNDHNRNTFPLLPSVQSCLSSGSISHKVLESARLKLLLNSSLVQSQLNAVFPYRRKLVSTARAFIAVFRIRSLAQKKRMTRNCHMEF